MILLCFDWFLFAIFLSCRVVARQAPHALVGELSLTEDEISTIFHFNDELDSVSRKPDCFRSAASQIRGHCGAFDMDEEERTSAAVSLTLCELATAKHHSIPMECVAFISTTTSSNTAHHYQRLEGCVEALSRSPQFWSSYSGYLREVPQLCYAFRRWNDIDTAKDIYRNATLEKIALVRFIVEREKATTANMHIWENHLENMKNIVAQIRALSTDTITTSQDITTTYENVFRKALESFSSAFLDLRRQSDEHHLQVIEETTTSLEHITERHAHSLEALLPSLEKSFLLHFSPMIALMRARSQESVNLATEANQQWISIGQGFISMQQMITTLSDAASDAVLALDTSTQHAATLHEIHREVSASTSALVETLTNLSVTTNNELEKINGTAARLQQSLKSENQASSWTGFLLKAAEVILRVDPVSFDSLTCLPVFRICLHLLGFIFQVLKVTFSSLMSVIVVMVSAKKYLSGFNLVSAQAPLPRSFTLPSHSPPLPQEVPLYHRRRPLRCGHVSNRPTRPYRVSRIPDRLCGPAHDFY